MNKERKWKLELLSELKRYLQSRFRTVSDDQAFVRWYVEARFGDLKGIELHVTDGANDGGIDAVVFTPDGAYAFQMKYERNPRLSHVSRTDVTGFAKLAEDFSSDERNFVGWLDTVKSDWHKIYRRLFQLQKSSPDSVRFIFVTTKYFGQELSPDSAIEVEDADKITPLWELYQEGFTPPVEYLNFSMADHFVFEDPNGKFTTYVGRVNLEEFRKAMKNDQNERLFAQNVRTDLGSKINDQIKETYEKEPGNFWLGNNGIYIICRDVSITGRECKILYPSIINGSQTLHSINKSEKHPECQVLVRILQMNTEKEHKLLSEIIRRTNSQNAMNLVNLFSQDAYQYNLARYLHGIKIFYERREKEWKNEKKNILQDFTPVSMKDLAQWLSVTHLEIGLGRARAGGVTQLFEDHYQSLFNSFDSKMSSSAYGKLPVLIWSALFTRSMFFWLPEIGASRARIAQLLLIKAVISAIGSSDAIDHRIKVKIENGEFGRKNIPLNIRNSINSSLRRIADIQKKKQVKEKALDFSNFFKRKSLPEDAYRQVFNERHLKQLSDLLISQLDKIY